MVSKDDGVDIDAASQRLDVMARLVALEIPAACRDGVLASLAILDAHAARLAEFVQDETVTPAPKFRP